jgi:hypothetical protein
LDNYKINPELKSANLFHLYNKGNAFPDGYYDSNFFDLYCYNTLTKEKRIIEDRDGISINDGVQIDMIRIFIDGSYFFRLKTVESIDIFQNVWIGKY